MKRNDKIKTYYHWLINICAIQLRDDHEMLEFCLEMFQLNKEFRTLTTQTGYTSSLFLLCPKAN